MKMSPLHFFQFILFSFCINLFILFSYVVYYSDHFFSNKNVQNEYDYVIVGSGTAGSVIAYRMAKETNHSFIVLEAGSRSNPLLEIPVLGPFLHRSVFDWQFESVPQKHACLAMKDKKCRLPQGRIFGGSSKLNNMIHLRGNISHYTNWFHGTYTEDYITKQFDFIEKEVLHINDVQYESDLANAVLKGAQELGYKNLDLRSNRDFGEGFTKPKVSQRNGKRWSISDKLPSEKIVTNALVEKVIFNGSTAVGVRLNLGDRKQTVYAKRGVILTAGAVNTPKILQLSGIGPKDVLNSLNIKPVKVLPVGKNLQDHVATGLDLVLFNSSVSINAFDMLNPLNAFQYFINGKGPLTTPGCEAVGLVSINNDLTPDIQFMVLPAGMSSDRGSLCRKNFGINDHVWENYFTKILDKYVATVLTVVLHPESRGEVYIRSKDPNDPPVFDPKYLSNKNDVTTLVDGLKLMKKLLETDAMKDIGAHLNTHKFPGCDQFEIFSDLYLECYVKQLTLTSYHPVGTCSMGLPGEKNTVVDTSFKVEGVDNLFVADSSVLPTLPSVNINAAVAMMASIFFDTNVIEKFAHENKCTYLDIFYDHLHNVCVVGQ